MGIVHLALRAKKHSLIIVLKHIFFHFAASTTNPTTSVGKLLEMTGSVMAGHVRILY